MARNFNVFTQHSSRQSGIGSTNPSCTVRMSGIFSFWSQDYNDEDTFTRLAMDGYPAGEDGVREFMTVWRDAVIATGKFGALKWYFMAGEQPPAEKNGELFGTWMMTKNVPEGNYGKSKEGKQVPLPLEGFMQLVSGMLNGDLCGDAGVIGVSCSPKKSGATLKIRTWRMLSSTAIDAAAVVFKHDSNKPGQEIWVTKWEACIS